MGYINIKKNQLQKHSLKDTQFVSLHVGLRAKHMLPMIQPKIKQSHFNVNTFLYTVLILPVHLKIKITDAKLCILLHHTSHIMSHPLLPRTKYFYISTHSIGSTGSIHLAKFSFLIFAHDDLLICSFFNTRYASPSEPKNILLLYSIHLYQRLYFPFLQLTVKRKLCASTCGKTVVNDSYSEYTAYMSKDPHKTTIILKCHKNSDYSNMQFDIKLRIRGETIPPVIRVP